MKKIKIPAKKRTIEYVVKKSRFIAIAEPLNHQNDVKRLINEKRALYPGSNHVVSAFFVNDDRSISGLSDDGEPHGTAGRPVYEVLKGSGLTDILITVTRYFGGTKLGTGGLVSAYGKSAKDVLEMVPVIEKIYTVKMKLILNYKIYDSVKKKLDGEGALNILEDFAAEIVLTADIPIEKRDEISSFILDVSRGEVVPEYLEKGTN